MFACPTVEESEQAISGNDDEVIQLEADLVKNQESREEILSQIQSERMNLRGVKISIITSDDGIKG